jgi:energy-coupling factor transporter ATP-binding protein EcfA2
MIRGKTFYAIWNKNLGMWSTDEFDVQLLVDEELRAYRDDLAKKTDGTIVVKYMSDFSTNSWTQWRRYLNHMSDSAVQLDEHLTFADTDVKKSDYVSKRLPYSIKKSPYDAWDELVGTLYSQEEREKIEWAIGAILSGDSTDIQKFVVLYGKAGAGKSTILNVIQKLFEGYYTTFDAKALTSSSNAFSTEVFRHNPLVAIQHDGDLSKIEDNTKLNSIVSHEEMPMNEKYKPTYTARLNCFLFMATNKPVKITDAKSGIIRRLIDVRTSGNRVGTRRYQALMTQIDFELGGIAYHCLEVYRKLGKEHYSTYEPIGMMYQTDTFFNFVEDHIPQFREEDGISLTRAYALYKEWCEDSAMNYRLPKHKFREELKNYFENFDSVTRVDGKQVRSYYSKFLFVKFVANGPKEIEEMPNPLVLDQTKSILDDILSDCPAQYSTRSGIPGKKWDDVETTLKDIDTKRVHYVKLPPTHIVIDFDLKDENGEKSAELNLEAASLWPPTYAEFSKGRNGIHLHYNYTGDPDRLSGVYSEGIEIKIPRGNASLRRRVSKCNNVPIADISGGLPLRGEKVINKNRIKSEMGLRRLVERNLMKDIHPATKPSIDFIHKILEEAYESDDIHYDLTDMRPAVLAFAVNSTNNSEYCAKKVNTMKFRSEEPADIRKDSETYKDDDPLVFFDVEVFPNLFLVSWKYQGAEKNVVHMINPTPKEIEPLFGMKLVGFNNRRYDNHMLYACYLGYSVEEIYGLSKRIVSGSKNGYFREAYNASYTDVYCFSKKKQSLKKWEIELGIKHHELGLPWDEPVPEDIWPKVVSYCEDDVLGTEKVFEHLKSDFSARQILAELSGLTVNHTTNTHVTRIIFGDDRTPQDKFNYVDLSEEFPGYEYSFGKSTYLGEEPGEGGYVYAEEGIYGDVALLDIASMHPTTIEVLDLFGPYTKNYSQIKAARVAIKHKNYDAAKGMLNGALEPYLGSPEDAEDLSNALKLVINSVYGLTSARFDNPFKDPRNIDNIVAKRGALFMIDLKNAVKKMGFTVVHCKTDSIKIADATQEVIDFVHQFGQEFGYDFEHEATYNKIALVNKAVYIARYSDDDPKHPWEWTATGAQFAHPYVFKTLFSKEPLEFRDYCETKSVTTEMYLDFNENLGEDEHNYQFVGRVGSFCPIVSGHNAGILLRKKDDKFYAVTGTKGYRWMEASVVESLDLQDAIDISYHDKLADKAIKTISKLGDFEWFVGEERYIYNGVDEAHAIPERS